MIELLLSLLVVILVFGIVWYCISIIPLPPPFPMIAQLVLLVIFLLIILYSVLPLLHVRTLPP